MNELRSIALLLLFGMVPGLSGLALAQERGKIPAVRTPEKDPPAASRVVELRRLVSEIRLERQKAVADKEAWDRDRAALEYEMEVLEREIARLQSPLPDLRTKEARLARETRAQETTLEADGQSNRKTRSLFQQFLSRMEALAAQSLPLKRTERLERIREVRSATTGTRATLSSLVGGLLGLVFQALTESRTFSADSTEMKDATGERRRVEILRIGTVQALALAPDSKRVQGTRLDDSGNPAWAPPREDPDLARAVRRGLDILLRRSPPALLSLPVPRWPAEVKPSSTGSGMGAGKETSRP